MPHFKSQSVSRETFLDEDKRKKVGKSNSKSKRDSEGEVKDERKRMHQLVLLFVMHLISFTLKRCAWHNAFRFARPKKGVFLGMHLVWFILRGFWLCRNVVAV